jgi:hypothetical protein
MGRCPRPGNQGRRPMRTESLRSHSRLRTAAHRTPTNASRGAVAYVIVKRRYGPSRRAARAGTESVLLASLPLLQGRRLSSTSSQELRRAELQVLGEDRLAELVARALALQHGLVGQRAAGGGRCGGGGGRGDVPVKGIHRIARATQEALS